MANELERIFVLKSEGLASVLADINQINEAFKASAKARAELSSSRPMFDSGQLETVNKQLAMMVDIQNDLLSTMKALTPEVSRVTTGTGGMSVAAKKGADDMAGLSGAAKTLGSNLSSVAPALLRVQTTLNTGAVEDYDSAINKLVSDLVIMQQLKAESTAAFTAGGNQDDVEALSRFNSKMSKLGFTIEGDDVFAGSARIPELTEEYQRLKGAIGGVTVSYEAYLKEQLELTNNINMLTEAIQLLNKTNNPSVPMEASLAYKQQSEEMKLGAMNTQEFIDKQIELKTLQASINEQVKSGVYKGSGKQAEDEAALLQKQILFGEAWVADLDKQNAKLAEREKILRANQELRGEANANDIVAGREKARPSNKAANKVLLQEERTQIELLKNQAIMANEAASYYQKLVAELNVLRIQYRGLITIEQIEGIEGNRMLTRIQALDAQVKKFDATLGNHQRNVGDYAKAGSNAGGVVNMFTRQLARGIGSLIIWGALFNAMSDAYEKMLALTPGTEEYIKAQNELNNSLVQTQSVFTQLITTADDFRKSMEGAFGVGITKAQAYTERVSAIGVVQGAVFDHETEQFEAQQKLRDAKLRDLSILHMKYYELNNLFHRIDKGGDVNKIRQDMYNLGLSDEDYRAAKTAMDEFLAAKRDDPQLKFGGRSKHNRKLYGNPAIEKADADVTAQTNRLLQEKLFDAPEAFANKIATIQRDEHLKLVKELRTINEQYRQSKTALDLETEDKIVTDTKAKYLAMIKDVERNKETYRLSVAKADDTAYVDKNIKAYNALLYTLKQIQNQEIANKEFQLADRLYSALIQTGASQSQSNAQIARFSTDYGAARYNEMVETLQKETDAKKQAIQVQFQAEVSKIEDSDQVIQAQKIRDAKIVQVDKEMYAQRIKLSMEYFHRITEALNSRSEILHTTIDTYSQDRQTEVWNRTPVKATRDRKLNKIDRQTIMAQADAEIRTAQQELKLLQAAKVDAEGTASAAEIAGDADKITLANAALNKVLAEQARLENLIAAARKRKAATKYMDDWPKLIGGAMIQAAEQVSNAYMELLAKQSAYRQEMMQRSLAWNQLIMNSEVQSSSERLAQQKAALLAERQMHRQQIADERNRARTQLWISYAIGLAKDWEMGWPAGAVAAAGQTIGLAASLNALAKAPAYAEGIYGNRSHPGGLAWVGDGGEHEVIISPNKPTLMNLERGSQVIPMSHLPGNLGSDLKAPRFTTSTTAGGGSSSGIDFAAHEGAIHGLYQIVGQMGAHLSNLQVNNDIGAANRASVKLNYRTKRI